MKAKTVTRRLVAFSLSAHTGDVAVANYQALFHRISTLPTPARVADVGAKRIALPVVRVTQGAALIVACEGELGVPPLFFDYAKGRARAGTVGDDEAVVTFTHCLLDLKSKRGVVELVGKGVRATAIAQSLSILARPDGTHVRLTPIPGPEFLTAINQLHRVRVATLSFSRPNPDWTDMKAKLTSEAGASNAQDVDVSFYAARSEGLDKRHGILDFVRKVIKAQLHIFSDAKIVGTYEGDTRETSVHLDRHMKSRLVTIKRDPRGQPDRQILLSEMRAFLDTL